jgi:hypothetical protein
MSLREKCLLDKLKLQDPCERDEALTSLGETFDLATISTALNILNDNGYELHEITIATLVYQIMVDPSYRLFPFLSFLEKSPTSKIGHDCAYILGEIAYLQEENRDSRIVLALLQAGEAVFQAEGVKAVFNVKSTLAAVVYSLRQCVYTTPVLEAESLVDLTISLIIGSDRDEYNSILLEVLEIAYRNDSENLLAKLDAALHDLPAEEEPAQTIQEFLNVKRNQQREFW